MKLFHNKSIIQFNTHYLNRSIPLEPAMKLNMSSFSGLVTTLAVLNISSASSNCSGCWEEKNKQNKRDGEGANTNCKCTDR